MVRRRQVRRENHVGGAARRSLSRARPESMRSSTSETGSWSRPMAKGTITGSSQPSSDAYVQTHLRDGIFYVKDHGTAPQFHDQMRAVLGGPPSVDYISAHQGFTGPNGHPIEIIDALAGIGVLPAEWTRSHGEGDALFVVASEQDVDRAWPRLLAGKPDFVKVFLVHSEEYIARRDNKALTPRQRGIDPALVPPIVARAHAAGLRVSAHIENAHDFHVAMAAGVDDIAHMPFVDKDNPDRYRLAEPDLRAGGVASRIHRDDARLDGEGRDRAAARGRSREFRKYAAGRQHDCDRDRSVSENRARRSRLDRRAPLDVESRAAAAPGVSQHRAPCFRTASLDVSPGGSRPASSCWAATR